MKKQDYGEQGEQENKRVKGDLQLVPMRLRPKMQECEGCCCCTLAPSLCAVKGGKGREEREGRDVIE